MAGQDSDLRRLLNAKIDGLYELEWNCIINDLVDELITAAPFSGLQPELHVSVITLRTYLLYVLALRLRAL